MSISKYKQRLLLHFKESKLVCHQHICFLHKQFYFRGIHIFNFILFYCYRMDLVRELEVCEKEQQKNAQYVEEFAMLTSEKVGYGFHSLEIWASVVITEAHIKDSDLKLT